MHEGQGLFLLGTFWKRREGKGMEDLRRRAWTLNHLAHVTLGVCCSFLTENVETCAERPTCEDVLVLQTPSLNCCDARYLCSNQRTLSYYVTHGHIQWHA